MDQRLFVLINQQWTGPVLDRVMAAASSFDVWLPFLLVLAVATAWRGGARARWCLASVLLLVVLGETVVDNPLKHAIHRLRPYQAMPGVREVNLERHAHPQLFALFEPLDIAVSTPVAALAPGTEDPFPGRSFPSSHTLNNFGAALVLSLFYRWRGALYFVPAALVGYSRIYVGSHWPSDVLVSAVLAIGVALITTALLQWAARRIPLPTGWLPPLTGD